MHFTTSAAVGLLAASAVATAFEFPASVPMNKRQTEGPSYDCHANCGYAIKNATGEYCKNDKWLGLLKGCLACANEFNIWQYYGNKVGAAAKACGLDATPKPAGNGGSSSSAVAASSAPPASSAPAGSKAASTPAASTPAATHASGTPVAQSSAAQTAAGSSSAASAASSGHPAASSSAGHSNTTTVVTGGAEKKQAGLVLAAGVLAAAWM